MTKKLKSPLKWYGGKTKLVSRLLPLIPEHNTYVEVFAGSAALFFGKPVSRLEVINDLDSGLVNFYRVMRDEGKAKELIRLLNLTPYSREEFTYFGKTWRETTDEVLKAQRWFVTMRMSFSGKGRGFSISIANGSNGISSGAGGYLASVDRLPEIHERLRGVQIEKVDFREIIEKYDRQTTFFYLDPPYVHSTRKETNGYAHEMTDQDHEDLVELLLGTKGKSMLSGYRHPIYLPLEDAGWERHDFKVKCMVDGKKREKDLSGNAEFEDQRTRVESVWIKR